MPTLSTAEYEAVLDELTDAVDELRSRLRIYEPDADV